MKRVINFYALILNLMGACLALPLVTALIYGERAPVRAFALVMVLCLALGGVIRLAFRTDLNSMQLKPRDSYFLVATVWLIASAVGCMPYVLTGSIPNFIEAFFETCSGFTTTGATIVEDVEALPRSVLLWRSFTQWLGGMGIIVLFVAFMPRFGIKARNILLGYLHARADRLVGLHLALGYAILVHVVVCHVHAGACGRDRRAAPGRAVRIDRRVRNHKIVHARGADHRDRLHVV